MEIQELKTHQLQFKFELTDTENGIVTTTSVVMDKEHLRRLKTEWRSCVAYTLENAMVVVLNTLDDNLNAHPVKQPTPEATNEPE